MMKRIKVIICTCACMLVVVGREPLSAAGASQIDRASSQSDHRPVGTNGAETPPSSQPPMASIDDQVKVLAADFNLTADQQAKVRAILQLQQQEARAVIFDRSLSQEQRMEKFRSLNEVLISKVRNLLTDDQKKTFDQRIGEKNLESGEITAKSAPVKNIDITNAPIPKLRTDLHPGSYKFQVKFDNGGVQQSMNLVTTIREEAGDWTATDIVDAPNGQSTDVSTLEKNTLILKKRSLKQGPVSVNLDFNSDKAEGSLSINGVQQPITADLGGPLFADSAGWEEVVACLPLALGYTATFRNFDLQKHTPKLVQLKVTGMETVTVPAGTFESFRVELAPIEGGLEKSTVWISSDSRLPVKVFAVLGSTGRATMNAELVR
jgi:hypothetical protein